MQIRSGNNIGYVPSNCICNEGPTTPTSADQASNSFEATNPDNPTEHPAKDRVKAATQTAEPLDVSLI